MVQWSYMARSILSINNLTFSNYVSLGKALMVIEQCDLKAEQKGDCKSVEPL